MKGMHDSGHKGYHLSEEDYFNRPGIEQMKDFCKKLREYFGT